MNIRIILILLVGCNQPIVKEKFSYSSYDIIAPLIVSFEKFGQRGFYGVMESNIKSKLRNRLVNIENTHSYHVYIFLQELEIEFKEDRKNTFAFFQIVKPINFNASYIIQINEKNCLADIHHYSYNLAHSSLKIKKDISLESLGLLLVLLLIFENNNLVELMLPMLGIGIYETYDSRESLKSLVVFLEDRLISEIEQKYINCMNTKRQVYKVDGGK
ncbi:MAG: hypothetical protein KBA66_12135 [Leptospiraceae bacterium]|nr:hypothetical protein [Leptospiraceae bacterium]